MFWWAAITVGGVLLVIVAALRLRDIRSTLVLVSLAGLTAALFVVAYLALPAVFLLF